MIGLLCSRGSHSAAQLVRARYAVRLRTRNDLRAFLSQDDPRLVVCWGQRWRGEIPPGVRILNPRRPMNKREELIQLARAGVPVPRVSTEAQAGWYARLLHHRSAQDLLANLVTGDYWVQPRPTVREFRVHVFEDRAFLVGLKVPRPGRNAHSAFRSETGGWALSYARADVERFPREAVRRAARAAVRALEYDFGAVDVGVTSHGQPVVYEVNSAPGLEGHTVRRYGEQFLATLDELRRTS